MTTIIPAHTPAQAPAQAPAHEHLLALLDLGARATSVETYLAQALPLLDAALAPGSARLSDDEPAEGPVEGRAGRSAARRPLAGGGTLVLSLPPDAGPQPAVEAFVLAVARLAAEDRHRELAARVAHAQHLAHMGDYDWHIPTDQNTWSDELYRIYGHEPQSFNATYERFLACLHPEDRQTVQDVHGAAYRTGEPYSMIERIVRPDGEVRHLASTGEVVLDADGVPVRMRGTCIDVTERLQAEQHAQRLAARFRSMVEACPDAVLVVDAGGEVVDRSTRAVDVLGGDPRGRAVDEVLPFGLTSAGEVALRRLDGAPRTVDVTVVALESEEPEWVVFVTDATPRMQREAEERRDADSRRRRRQAFEINDSVVQGLAAATYALDQGLLPEARAVLGRTLEASRNMMGRLLQTEAGDLRPGGLVRSSAADLESLPTQRFAGGAPRRNVRVLVVDDAEDIRTLLRLRLMRASGVEVVGEAGDGVEAVALATALEPDVVLLDMAMPRMDGLEALPLIRAAVPGVRVVVLSGFDEGTMRDRALEAGADRYLVKGGDMDALLAAIEDLTAA
jgi:PAS domain S-box-containing protein